MQNPPMSEVYYTNEMGMTVFTSTFHKQRGNCCLAACLHCPYGYSIEKEGFSFEKIYIGNCEEAKKIYPKDNYENFLLVTHKGFSAALVKVDSGQIKDLYLGQYFTEMGITKELLQKYLF